MSIGVNTVYDASVDNTNQVVAARGCTLRYFLLSNPGTVDAYFQVFDALTADVTVGTTTPKASFIIPAGVSATQAGAYEYTGPPIHFQKGLVYACTTTSAGGTDPVVKPVLGLLEWT